MFKEQGSQPQNETPETGKGKINRRKFLGGLVGVGLATVGGKIVKEAMDSNQETHTQEERIDSLESRLAQKHGKKELESGLEKFKDIQEEFEQKFDFPAEIDVPELLRYMAQVTDDGANNNNRCVQIIYRADALLKAVVNNDLFDNLKSVHAKRWNIPVGYIPNTPEGSKIIDTLVEALNNDNEENGKKMLQTVGFEF